jgi:2-dehydro-3-deoxygalactonokinase
MKYKIGAAIGCDQKDLLQKTLKEGIAEILSKNALREGDVSRILASGMITSEGGLCTLKHLQTPCGISELARCMHECIISEITSIPFVFARGVITDTTTIEELDIMRGEETELFGLTEQPKQGCLYILPGTHSKMIYTDECGRICHFTTLLSGELISAISGNTILKNSISLDTCAEDFEYLERGYICAGEHGAAAAFFKVRILDKILGASREQCFSFFIGAVLQDEVDRAIRSSAKKIVIGGRRELRVPLAYLLQKHTKKPIDEVCDDIADNAAALGVIRLYEEYLKGKCGHGKALQ